MLGMLFLLLMAHAVTDFGLQSEWMARAKNFRVPPSLPPPGQRPNVVWPFVLLAHALINAAGVYVVTQRMGFAVFECVAHFGIDLLKCYGGTDVYRDQFLHLSTKLMIAATVAWGSVA